MIFVSQRKDYRDQNRFRRGRFLCSGNLSFRDQDDHSRGDRRRTADFADPFSRLCFDADPIEYPGPAFPAIVARIDFDVWSHFGTFGQNDAVEIDDFHSTMPDSPNRLVNKIAAIAVPIRCVIIRK